MASLVAAAPVRQGAWLAALCFSRFAASLAFMMYAAALPAAAAAWGMDAAAAGSVQSAFNLAYGVSLVAAAALADRLGAKRVFLWSSVLAALAALAFAAFARSHASALTLFALLGLAQGGTYAPVLMLVVQGLPAARRGSAVGLTIAAGSLGYVAAVSVAAAVGGDYVAVFALCGTAPLIGVVAAVLALRGQANAVPRPTAPAAAGGGRPSRTAALLTAGYTAHSWELLGLWAWLPGFVAVAAGAQAGPWIGLALHGPGCIAAIAMGRAADRLGHRRVLVATAFAGALGCFALAASVDGPLPLVVALAAFCSFAALGDSPVLTAAMGAAVPADRLGRALAVRSILGFGAGGLAPLAFGRTLGAADAGGAWATGFMLLGAGGLVAAASAVLLRAAPSDASRRTVT